MRIVYLIIVIYALFSLVITLQGIDTLSKVETKHYPMNYEQVRTEKTDQ